MYLNFFTIHHSRAAISEILLLHKSPALYFGTHFAKCAYYSTTTVIRAGFERIQGSSSSDTSIMGMAIRANWIISVYLLIPHICRLAQVGVGGGVWVAGGWMKEKHGILRWATGSHACPPVSVEPALRKWSQEEDRQGLIHPRFYATKQRLHALMGLFDPCDITQMLSDSATFWSNQRFQCLYHGCEAPDQ